LFKVIMSVCSVYMLLFRSGWLRVFPGIMGVVLLVGSLCFFMEEGELIRFYKIVIVSNFFAACFSLFLFLGLALRKGVRFV
ncbi:hypothetical protein, partial [Pseudomonas sp.]|uniref:hypothetical protein n=1 Tax=Pseudomonas sp. TaxID=306 RepID=UPI003BB72B8A